jgi:hypothetical protein
VHSLWQFAWTKTVKESGMLLVFHQVCHIGCRNAPPGQHQQTDQPKLGIWISAKRGGCRKAKNDEKIRQSIMTAKASITHYQSSALVL